MTKKYSIIIALSLCAGLQAEKIESSIYKINSAGKPVPYFGDDDSFGQHRQLGAVQINPSAAGITISKPGKYILADDVSASAASGAIRITISNVDLDLNGFSVVNSAGRGIDVGASGVVENIRIGNGTVRNCTSDGIRIQNTTKMLLRDVLSTSHTGTGVDFVTSCTNVVVENCRADNNGGDGLHISEGFQFELRQVISNNNSFNGINFLGNNFIFESCSSLSNGGRGFTGTTSASIGLDAVVIRDCQANRNVGTGMRFDGTLNEFNGMNIEDCECIGNGQEGILVEVGNTIVIRGCTIGANSSRGIDVETPTSAIISNNIVSGNVTHGILVNTLAQATVLVEKNSVHLTSGAGAADGIGIQVNLAGAGYGYLIDNESMLNAGYGIRVDGVGYVGVVRNSSIRNNSSSLVADNYQVGGGAVVATTLLVSGAATNPWGNVFG